MCASHFIFSREDYAFSIVFGVIVLAGGAKRVMTCEDPTWTRDALVTHYTIRAVVVRGCMDMFVGIAALVFGVVNLI